jgi:tetratricopeptide (TPR) repeat protein
MSHRKPLVEPLPDLPLAAIGVAASAVGISLLAGGWGRADHAPFPYVWRDVALVHFLCALPLAALVAGWIGPRLSAPGRLGTGAGLFVAALVLILLARPSASWLGAAVQRAGPALCFAAACALAVQAIWPRSTAAAKAAPSPVSLAVAVAILLAAPLLHVHARVRSDLARLAELIDQTRVGEAQSLAARQLALAPQAQFHDRPLALAASELDRVAAELTARAAVPLPEQATGEERLERARDLAILGRTEESLALLDAAPSLGESAAAALLQGTIHQARREWSASLAAFSRASQLVQRQPASPERDEAHAEAISGIAFSYRKLGDNPAAAAAYRQVLALAPTAHTHFLLAQFYEDTQQAQLAERHARQAMQLDPGRYDAPGRRLIDKLRTTHFSCWAVGAQDR